MDIKKVTWIRYLIEHFHLNCEDGHFGANGSQNAKGHIKPQSVLPKEYIYPDVLFLNRHGPVKFNNGFLLHHCMQNRSSLSHGSCCRNTRTENLVMLPASKKSSFELLTLVHMKWRGLHTQTFWDINIMIQTSDTHWMNLTSFSPEVLSELKFTSVLSENVNTSRQQETLRSSYKALL